MRDYLMDSLPEGTLGFKVLKEHMFDFSANLCYNFLRINSQGMICMVEHILKASLEKHKVITIIYQKDEEITQRDIRVLDMDNEKVKAMCYLKHQPRVFKKECILAAGWSKVH